MASRSWSGCLRSALFAPKGTGLGGRRSKDPDQLVAHPNGETKFCKILLREQLAVLDGSHVILGELCGDCGVEPGQEFFEFELHVGSVRGGEPLTTTNEVGCLH